MAAVKENGVGATGWLISSAAHQATARVSKPTRPVAPDPTTSQHAAGPWLKDTPRRHPMSRASKPGCQAKGAPSQEEPVVATTRPAPTIKNRNRCCARRLTLAESDRAREPGRSRHAHARAQTKKTKKPLKLSDTSDPFLHNGMPGYTQYISRVDVVSFRRIRIPTDDELADLQVVRQGDQLLVTWSPDLQDPVLEQSTDLVTWRSPDGTVIGSVYIVPPDHAPDTYYRLRFTRTE